MAVLNFAHRQITAKIVYFGPKGAGCNTNVRRLWETLEGTPGLSRGRLHRFGAAEAPEHTWFFDLKPDGEVGDEVSGFSVRYRIYSMPGGVDDPTHRQEVMRHVDAIVLVADSRPDANAPNEDAMLELEELVGAQGLDLAKLPVVLQVNHLDHANARGADDVTFALNPFGFPVIQAVAREGEGVRETFDTIAELARARLADNIAGRDGAVQLMALHDDADPSDDELVRSHASRLVDAPTPDPQTQTSNKGPSTPAPADAVEVPFQPREFAGSYPVRVVNAAIDDGQVFVDVELERMGGGEVRQLRVKLANRPTDAPAAPRAPAFSVVTEDPPSVMGVTDHLPDKVDFHTPPPPADLPPVVYGLVGVVGGAVAGVLLGFLLFV
ncbi:MAG: GTPase domain-containing protein [Alphaproteobacteria bacterium]|nr:GTPase domain-containing protein [Alphaproteobacteria bacterium]MCB9694993.1 GTPase domain-containing protein [Alphaproteobacteria bacterium]